MDTPLRFDCNPSLDATDFNAGIELSTGGAVFTKRLTNVPTTKNASPAVITGVVWYDANHDGRRNDPNTALTEADFITSEQERGAGLGNLKVTLRRCDTHDDVAVTYTFPSGMTEERGEPQVFDATYLQQIINEDYYNNQGSSGGVEEVKIGMYSFQVLPNMIPGEYYVVFESPRGYMLTNGGGKEWEVGVEMRDDMVFPMIVSDDGKGRGSPGGVRRGLQSSLEEDDVSVNVEGVVDSFNNETIITSPTETIISTIDYSNAESGNEPTNNASTYNNLEQSSATKRPTEKPTSYEGYIPKFKDFSTSLDLDTLSSNKQTDLGPITHSGYFSRSKCISIRTNQILIEEINAGISEATWPLSTFQYASFVLTLSFFEQSEDSVISCPGRKQRRQLQKDSLECREYAKKKAEGIPVDDVWGCDTEAKKGISVDEFVTLTLEQVSTQLYSISD